MVLETLWKAELLKGGRYGIYLSSRELTAEDTNTEDEKLIFTILRAPYFGYLENATNGNKIVTQIYQQSSSILGK